MERFTTPNMNYILIGLSFHIFYKLINLTDQILIKYALGNGLYSTASLIFLLMFLKPTESENQCHRVCFSAISLHTAPAPWCWWVVHWEERVKPGGGGKSLFKGQMPPLALLANSKMHTSIEIALPYYSPCFFLWIESIQWNWSKTDKNPI